MKYPKAYYQIKKIREFWIKSKTENKDEIIKEFDEALYNIECQMLNEINLLEAWELSKQ